jgi:hypothetical protein
MLQSHVIDINGTFVGAAVRLDRGYRFVALDIRLEDLDGQVHPTLADVERLARQLFLSGSFVGQRSLPPAAATTSPAQPLRRVIVSAHNRLDVEARNRPVVNQPAPTDHHPSGAVRAA